jgi:hypothetical protein
MVSGVSVESNVLAGTIKESGSMVSDGKDVENGAARVESKS